MKERFVMYKIDSGIELNPPLYFVESKLHFSLSLPHRFLTIASHVLYNATRMANLLTDDYLFILLSFLCSFLHLFYEILMRKTLTLMNSNGDFNYKKFWYRIATTECVSKNCPCRHVIINITLCRNVLLLLPTWALKSFLNFDIARIRRRTLKQLINCITIHYQKFYLLAVEK